MPDFTARITEILGAHRLEQGIRIGGGERVEWWECLGCDWKSELFDLDAPGIENVKRNHHATLIAKAAEDHYRPRIENPEQLAALPQFTVVQFRGEALGEANRVVWQLDGEWFPAGDPISMRHDELPPEAFPAVVVWSPGVGE